MNPEKQPVTLIGAGLAGSLLSIYLARRGYSVRMYERRPDMRKVAISAGRSINLALSVRGIHALKEVGIFDAIAPLMISMKGRMIHPLAGETQLQPYGKDESEVIHSISRGGLNIALMNAAEATGKVTIEFDHSCTGYDPEKQVVTFASGEPVQAEPVIGTDGSASVLRHAMKAISSFREKSELLDYGYKELVIPPASNGSHRIFKNALHIWPRKTFMLIALPNLDGSFTCTLFLRFKGSTESFETLTDITFVEAFFSTHFPDALPLMPTLNHDFFENPTGQMVTIKCSPWNIGGKVALLGDASHAIVPFFGQGMNCAFEDCSVLNEILKRRPGDWNAAFSEFGEVRKPNTDAIADMAVENFIEMRDKVADPFFQLKKRAEKILEARHPDRFVPKYSMVSFRRIPYAVARDRGAVQEEILNTLCAGIQEASELNLTEADHLIQERLSIL